MTAPNQLWEFLRARRSRLQPSDVGLPNQAARDHDAMTLLPMIASGEQTPGRLPSPGRPPA